MSYQPSYGSSSGWGAAPSSTFNSSSTGTSLASASNGKVTAAILIKYNNGNLYEDVASPEFVKALDTCKAVLRKRSGLRKVKPGQLVAAANLVIGNVHSLTSADWGLIAEYVATQI